MCPSKGPLLQGHTAVIQGRPQLAKTTVVLQVQQCQGGNGSRAAPRQSCESQSQSHAAIHLYVHSLEASAVSAQHTRHPCPCAALPALHSSTPPTKQRAASLLPALLWLSTRAKKAARVSMASQVAGADLGVTVQLAMYTMITCCLEALRVCAVTRSTEAVGRQQAQQCHACMQAGRQCSSSTLGRPLPLATAPGRPPLLLEACPPACTPPTAPRPLR